MKRTTLLVAVTLALTLVVSSTATGTTGSTFERTAPYDYGETDGTLIGASVPCVTYGYFPLPAICPYGVGAGTETGIFVDITDRSVVTVSATIENVSPSEPALAPMELCFGYGPAGTSTMYRHLDCAPAPPSGESSTISTSFADTVWEEGLDAGRHTFTVHLKPAGPLTVGGPHAMKVRKMSVSGTPV